MPEHWVINASPIILLAKAEVIHLGPALCDKLVIPAGVVEEVSQGALADAGRRWLATVGTKHVKTVSQIQSSLAEWHGGAGEAEVVTGGPWSIRESKPCLMISELGRWPDKTGIQFSGVSD